MRRYGELSRGAERSSPRQFFPDCTIAMRGYDFREGQGEVLSATSLVTTSYGSAARRVARLVGLRWRIAKTTAMKPVPGRAVAPKSIPREYPHPSKHASFAAAGGPRVRAESDSPSPRESYRIEFSGTTTAPWHVLRHASCSVLRWWCWPPEKYNSIAHWPC